MTPKLAPPFAETRDDAWEGLTHGTLSKDEEAVLRALAEENEADAARFEAHAPLDEAFRARVTESIAARLAAREKQRSRGVYLGGVSLSLVVAAAALVVWTSNQSPALPPYTLVVEGADAVTRGAPPIHESLIAHASPVPSISSDGVLTLIARPMQRVQASVRGHLFVLDPEGAFRPVTAQSEAVASGAVRINVAATALPFAGTDVLTLLLVVSTGNVSAERARELIEENDPSALLTRIQPAQR